MEQGTLNREFAGCDDLCRTVVDRTVPVPELIAQSGCSWESQGLDLEQFPALEETSESVLKVCITNESLPHWKVCELIQQTGLYITADLWDLIAFWKAYQAQEVTLGPELPLGWLWALGPPWLYFPDRRNYFFKLDLNNGQLVAAPLTLQGLSFESGTLFLIRRCRDE